MFASGEPLSRVVPLAIAAWTAAPTLALGGQTTPAPSMSLCSRKETRAPFRCHSLRSGWPLAKSWLRLRPHEGCPRLRLRGAEGLAPLFLTSALGCLKPYGFAAKNSRACGALCRPGGLQTLRLDASVPFGLRAMLGHGQRPRLGFRCTSTRRSLKTAGFSTQTSSHNGLYVNWPATLFAFENYRFQNRR